MSVKADSRGRILVRLSSKTGPTRGRLTIESTNGEWADVSCDLTQPITGIQDVCFTFMGTGQSLFDFDSWQFSEEPTAIRTTNYEHNANNKRAFDLLGRETKNGGLRIVDGKKVLNRQ